MVTLDRVSASRVKLESRLTQLVRLVTKEGASVDSWMFLGEVVGVHIAPELIDDCVTRLPRPYRCCAEADRPTGFN
jgi:flavin reductase (DIM6/NTAB) family NADH-FMN oxidoreductase RutF